MEYVKLYFAAGHCVRNERETLAFSEILVILGKFNLQKWVPTNIEKIIEPKSIVVHPDYEPLTSDADIAVIELNEHVKFTKFIRPLCLWSGTGDLADIVGEYMIIACGYRLLKFYVLTKDYSFSK